MHHFADDTNLLHFNISTKKPNRLINLDMKQLFVWLNKCQQNLPEYTGDWINDFLKKRKILNHEIKVKLNRMKLYPAISVKYLGLKIGEKLNWHHHINDLAAKLNRANFLLFKIRNYVNQKILRSIYNEIFDFHLNYANLIWAQNFNAILMSFKSFISKK